MCGFGGNRCVVLVGVGVVCVWVGGWQVGRSEAIDLSNSKIHQLQLLCNCSHTYKPLVNTSLIHYNEISNGKKYL